MKIAVISPNPEHLRDMGAALQGNTHTAVLVEGGKSRMLAVAEQEQPDLMLVDGMCLDPQELQQVDDVATHHPHIAIVLLCATHTPEFLIQSMRAGVREVLPSPAPAAALEAAVNRVAAKMAGAPPRSGGKILAFVSCKGGAGATFLATNLAYPLAENRSVLLVDLNLQFGDALSCVHDGKPASTLADLAKNVARLDASLLAASTVKIAPNYSLLAAPETPAEAMEVKPEHIRTILALAATQYDFVLLDVGRGVDPLSIQALDRADRIFVVLQAAIPHVRNAHKLLAVFRSLGYPPQKAELIVNRFERGCDIAVEDIRRSLGGLALTTVANSYREVNASINQGDALAKTSRSSAVIRNLADLARGFDPGQDESRGFFGRIFRRA
ncbi:MAG: AAA family ATPase [Ramlibacter sp.]